MESYSHSHFSHSHHSRSHSKAQPSTFSNHHKKPPTNNNNNNNNNLNNNNNGGVGFFATSYDDVFGGPPRYTTTTSTTLAPRAEDYSEIFGAFRSSSRAPSSIPVLDLPAVTDIETAGGSLFDYSEVFGGFRAVEFAVSYDELFRNFDCGDCGGEGYDDDEDDDEAWTPVGTESLSDDSDPFAFSEKSQCFSNDSHRPLDNKQFNVSYHKVNVGTSTCMPNMTHVTQLNAVPGYTCVVEGTKSLREVRKERSTGDDIVFSLEPSSTMSQKHTRKTMSEMPRADADLQSYDSERGGRAHVATMPHVNSTFSSASDINLITEPSHLPPPSRPPPVPAEKNGEFSRLTSGVNSSDNCHLEATFDDRLPPCFDMEVDASSSAAASAAAMKDAMEKAQAKLKAAKVLMDRKKDGHQNAAKLGLKTEVNGGENVKTVLDECVSGNNRMQTASVRGPAKMKNSGKDRYPATASHILPDISLVEQPTIITGNPSEKKKHGKKSKLSMDTAFTGGAGEWKEATQYYEFINNDDTRIAPSPPTNGDMMTEALKSQYDDEVHNSDSAVEACVPAENRRKLKATKAVSRQEYYDKMVKVALAQEVHDKVIGGHAETNEIHTAMPQGTHREQRVKLGYESGEAQQAEVEKPGEACRNEEAEIRSNNVVEKEEIKKNEAKKKETDACHREQNERNTNDSHQSRVKEVPESKEEERRMRRSPERVESGRRVQETVVIEENEMSAKEACKRQRKENKLADAVKQKKNTEKRGVKDKRSNEPFEDGIGEDRQNTARESQESDKIKDLRRKVEDTSKEAFKDMFGGEILQGACGSQENEKTDDLPQRDENRKYFEEDVDGRGSEKIPQECVKLEECRKHEEAPEQVTRRRRLDEAHNLEATVMKTEEGHNQEKNEERLEDVMEQQAAESKAMQEGQSEEAVKNLKNPGDVEDQKITSRRHSEVEWEGKDQGSKSSSEIELPVANEHVKSSDRDNVHEKDVELDTLISKLKKPQKEANDFQDVSAWNDVISAVPSDEKSKLKAGETADVLMDEKPTESTAPQVGADDNEQERRTVHASDSLYGNDNNTKSEQKLNEEAQNVAQLVSDPKLPNHVNLEQEGKRKNVGEGHVTCDKEKVKPWEGINGWNEQARKKEEAHTVMLERKESFQKRSQLPNISQSTERKGKIINEDCSSEEKVKERERQLENEQLRKLEEEREREREREKDRMAVEFAIHEARERAYSDARDKAGRAALDRATDEARQRAMAEARERLEKACAEARERSLADKALEARLRAERAAVERATAEARQRAIEKAMVERVALEARERMQRSISEKYTCERDVIMRQSSMPSISKEFEAADVEPAQRCKARLERHQRTVERVAKAPAEKNMRDLQAQREQAERNRLAETLDADIKRWKSGKEGNLRALLSTLQYILGPDSGWQSIPLTEVITAAAVKKAYRKATLCVHPDKLQQRGASIQQKYICEKVFDLLKEAWNRFNSEEK